MSLIAEKMQINPSDKNLDFTTGATRGDNSGQGTAHLLPFDALGWIAEVCGGWYELPAAAIDTQCQLFEAGAKKYAARNWEKGIPLARYIDSAWRHYSKDRRGMVDEPHPVQFAWNALCALQTYLWIVEGKLDRDLGDHLPNLHFDPECLLTLDSSITLGKDGPAYYANHAWNECKLFLQGGNQEFDHLVRYATFSLGYLDARIAQDAAA